MTRWAVCLLLTMPALSHAQQSAPPELQEARQLLQTNQTEAAIAVLKELVAKDPTVAPAWQFLGQAYSTERKYKEAIKAFKKAQDFPPLRGRALRGEFLAVAGLGDFDRAAELWVEIDRSAPTDLNSFHLRPEFQRLSEDPRFAALFPSDFSEPFQEKDRVIHDWRGEGPGHEFGWKARSVGDVDGDSVDDVVTSAPGNQPGADSSGLIYVYSGKTGKLIWIRKGEPGDQLGVGVEAAGDVNGDGIPDVIAGAPGVDRVYVFSGGDGAKLHTLVGMEDDLGTFGNTVSAAGDVDGDGRGDVLVGASGAAQGAGRAYLFSGASGAKLHTWQGENSGELLGSAVSGDRKGESELILVGAPGAGSGGAGEVYAFEGRSSDPKFVIEADDTGARLGGMFLSVVGDVDADGTKDVYASDWANSAKGPQTGRIYVHSGKTGKRLLTLTGEGPGDGFGIGPARAGDVNGDGHADLVIGAWQYRKSAASAGKIYVHSGKDGSLLESVTGVIAGETFGFDADGVGDVNGDGRFDYLITSAWSLVRGIRSGRTLIVAGSVDRPTSSNP